MKTLKWAAGALLALALLAVAAAQSLAPGNVAPVPNSDPDPSSIPSFSTERLLPLDMPRHLTLQFGVDPATISITPQGVVRYVMLALNKQGPVQALYEGIRCQTGEVKTYARWQASGAWRVLDDAPWRALSDNQPSPHALAFARQGACPTRAAAAQSVADIVQALRYPNALRNQ